MANEQGLFEWAHTRRIVGHEFVRNLSTVILLKGSNGGECIGFTRNSY